MRKFLIRILGGYTEEDLLNNILKHCAEEPLIKKTADIKTLKFCCEFDCLFYKHTEEELKKLAVNVVKNDIIELLMPFMEFSEDTHTINNRRIVTMTLDVIKKN